MANKEELNAELKEVREKIQEIKKKANSSKLPGKIQKVAENYGKFSDWGGGQYHFSEKGLSITYSSLSQKYLRVGLGYGSKDVFAGKLLENGVGDIHLYIPGEWEKRINELYNEIPKITNNREIRHLQNKIYDLKKKWEMEA